MPFLNTRSLHGKFLLILLPATLVISLFVIGVFSILTVGRFESELLQKQQALSQSVAVVMAEPLWNYQYEVLQQIAQTVLTDKDLVGIKVLDEGRHEVLTLLPEPIDPAWMEVTQPIIYHNAHIQQQAGQLILVYSHHRLEQMLWQRVGQDILLLGILIVGLFAGSWIISRYVVRKPLDRMLHAMHQSQAVGALQPVYWHSDDEIGELITQYNQLQMQLAAKEGQLLASRARYHALYHNTPALMLSIGADGHIQDVSDYLCQAFALERGALLSSTFWQYQTGDDAYQVRKQLQRSFANQLTVRDVKMSFKLAQGEIDVLLTAVPEYSESNQYVGHLVVLSDVTQLHTAYRQIERQANEDSLTQLANRHYFQNLVNQAFSNMETPVLTLFFIDLDGFKAINDSEGHLVGDKLLVLVTKRMSHIVQEQGLLARIGGDEFAIVLEGSHTDHQINQLSQDLLGQVAQPYNIDGITVRISASIGIAQSPEDCANPIELIRFADIAMYQAKKNGKNAVCYYGH